MLILSFLIRWLWLLSENMLDSSDNSSHKWMGRATSDQNGDSTINGLPAGNLKLRFSCSIWGYAPEWYNDKADFDSADPVTVTAGGVTSGIDAVLDQGGMITGRVTNRQGVGISDFGVDVYDSNHKWIEYAQFFYGDGKYAITGLPAGNFKVAFSTYGTTYIDEWYNDKPDFNSADLVTVTLGNETPNINAILERVKKPIDFLPGIFKLLLSSD